MSKRQPSYKPYGGVEYAFSPELVDAMYDEERQLESEIEDLDLSGLRPVHEEVVVNEVQSRRGNFVITTTTTHRIISNRPSNTTTNTTGAQTS